MKVWNVMYIRALNIWDPKKRFIQLVNDPKLRMEHSLWANYSQNILNTQFEKYKTISMFIKYLLVSTIILVSRIL